MRKGKSLHGSMRTESVSRLSTKTLVGLQQSRPSLSGMLATIEWLHEKHDRVFPSSDSFGIDFPGALMLRKGNPLGRYRTFRP